MPMMAALSSCSVGIKTVVTKSYPPLSLKDSVKVIPLESPAPASAELLGNVHIFDQGGSVNCGYDVVIEAAKTEARKAGGNALKITEHLLPSFWGSSCDQIKADILRIDLTNTIVDTIPKNIPQQATAGHISTTQQNTSKGNNPYKAFYLTVEGGWSWRTSKTDPSLNSFQKEYISNLKSGHHYGFSAMYYTSRSVGIGLMYDNHISSNSVEATATSTTTGLPVSGELRDAISISFIGASIDFRGFSASERNSFHSKISLGYCGYKDVGGFINYGRIEGSTFGISYDLSYDINLVDHWYFTPSLAYRIATLSSYDVYLNNNTQHVTLDKDHYEGLSRIDLSGALRYRW